MTTKPCQCWLYPARLHEGHCCFLHGITRPGDPEHPVPIDCHDDEGFALRVEHGLPGRPS